MDPSRARLLRQLPAVDELLRRPDLQALLSGLSRSFAAEVIRQVLAAARQEILSLPAASLPQEFDEAVFRRHLAAALESARRPSLTRVVNATGVIIHTNLGRSPLGAVAQEAILEAARSYSNLEYDLKAGGRGSRQSHLEAILTELTRAEAALVVNNNAAAVMLSRARNSWAQLRACSMRRTTSSCGQGMKMRAEQTVYAGEPRSGTGASPPRFLVVDDEPEGRALVSGIILSRYPAAVIRAASSNAEAFQILLGFAPDIVVTELSRKGGAGYEFLRKLRQCPQLARTPVVLSSRRGRDADAFGISVEGLHEAAGRRISQEAMLAALFEALLGRGAVEGRRGDAA